MQRQKPSERPWDSLWKVSPLLPPGTGGFPGRKNALGGIPAATAGASRAGDTPGVSGRGISIVSRDWDPAGQPGERERGRDRERERGAGPFPGHARGAGPFPGPSGEPVPPGPEPSPSGSRHYRERSGGSPAAPAPGAAPAGKARQRQRGEDGPGQPRPSRLRPPPRPPVRAVPALSPHSPALRAVPGRAGPGRAALRARRRWGPGAGAARPPRWPRCCAGPPRNPRNEGILRRAGGERRALPLAARPWRQRLITLMTLTSHPRR